MWSLIATLAGAQTPSTEAIQAQVDAQYGKPVPKEAVCVARPELGTPFNGSPTPVGVRRGPRGCVLIGVMVGDQWLEPAAALAPALDRSAFDALDAAGKTAQFQLWVDRVLLAFDQPAPGGLSQVTFDNKRSVTVVDRRYRRRDDAPGRSADVVTKWTFDKGLIITGNTEQVLAREDVSLYQRVDKLEGGIEEAAVDEAIRSKGLVIRKCFTEAWEHDLGLTGRVKLEWKLLGGKVSEIVILAEEDTNDKLASCYARAVKGATYPPGSYGLVRWVFGVERTEVK